MKIIGGIQLTVNSFFKVSAFLVRKLKLTLYIVLDRLDIGVFQTFLGRTALATPASPGQPNMIIKIFYNCFQQRIHLSNTFFKKLYPCKDGGF